MNVLIINTSDDKGGAAIAAKRLMQALNKNDISANLLVLRSFQENKHITSLENSLITKYLSRFRFLWERFIIFCNNGLSRKNLFRVSIANTGFDLSEHPLVKQADILHLHWINQGLLSLKSIDKLIKLNKPVFCTMHDMWFCTGICHHARECNYYQTQCHDCLYLNKPKHRDLSYRIFNRKKTICQSGKITFITCSRWLKSRAEKSALLSGQKTVSVPNPIDPSLFRPMDQLSCREKFNLPSDKKLILFGAVKISDERKGIHYLIKAVEFLSQKYGTGDMELVIFGKSNRDISEIFKLKVNYLNYLSNEEDMVALYNAVDVYVTPSLDENLPNTIMEAMACGTPCVGFKTGGIPEMIDHQQNGYVAGYEDSKDLAEGIHWTLFEANCEQLSRSARQKALDCYSEETVAKQYINLYQQFL